MTRRVLLDGPDLKPAHFAYADSVWLSDAPAHCPRCGGLWREVSDGLQCRQCPRRWLVAEKLRALISQPREAEVWGHRIGAPSRRQPA